MDRVTDLAVQLAVGEGAGTPFAELGIGFRLEVRGALQKPNVSRLRCLTGCPVPAAAVETHLGQQQRCEITAGTGTNHHRTRWIFTVLSDEARATKR